MDYGLNQLIYCTTVGSIKSRLYTLFMAVQTACLLVPYIRKL